MAGTRDSPFIIATDIDLYNAPPTGPIGIPSTPFTGSYDGDGNTNITLSATTITATESAGALIRHLIFDGGGSTVTDVRLAGIVDGGGTGIGGLSTLPGSVTVSASFVEGAT